MAYQVTSTVLCPPLPGQRHRSRPIKASAPIHTCTLPVCRAYHNLPPKVIEIVASFFFFLAPFFYIRAPSSLCFFFRHKLFIRTLYFPPIIFPSVSLVVFGIVVLGIEEFLYFVTTKLFFLSVPFLLVAFSPFAADFSPGWLVHPLPPFFPARKCVLTP